MLIAIWKKRTSFTLKQLKSETKRTNYFRKFGADKSVPASSNWLEIRAVRPKSSLGEKSHFVQGVRRYLLSYCTQRAFQWEFETAKPPRRFSSSVKNWWIPFDVVRWKHNTKPSGRQATEQEQRCSSWLERSHFLHDSSAGWSIWRMLKEG